MFHSIYSFTPESAEQAGLHTLTDWEDWVKYHINEIATCMNMKVENIEYLAAVHLKDGQPHVHVMWWDIQQQILINKVDPKICDAIRIAAIKSTYRDELNELHNKEDSLIRTLRDEVKSDTSDTLSGKTSDQYKADILNALQHIKDIMPKQGRAAYGLMPQEVKSELDQLTKYIIETNPRFKALYDEIFEQRKLLNEMLHSSDTNYGKYQLATYTGKLSDEVNRAVGNAILKALVQQNKTEQLDANRASHKRINITSQLLNTVLGILTSHRNESNNALHSNAAHIFGRGDLSKEQIAELIYQLSDKQNTAEM